MDVDNDFYDKELNLNCFNMLAIFEKKYPKSGIVSTKEKID